MRSVRLFSTILLLVYAHSTTAFTVRFPVIHLTTRYVHPSTSLLFKSNQQNARRFCCSQSPLQLLAATTTSAALHNNSPLFPKWKAALVKTGMICFIAMMCIALPVTLLPQKWIGKLIPYSVWSEPKRQRRALLTGQFCARWLLRFIPFCKLQTARMFATGHTAMPDTPVPSIWVCNHSSMLDVFLLLACDKQLRGRNRRPIQVVYWKGLEANPITRLLFTQAGFISVNMADNGHGTANEYDKSSFKQLLLDCKRSIANGFDIALLPEGQINPTPELGLLPAFGGAYTLAKLAKRPIQFMAMHGAHTLWPAHGMTVTGRSVSVHAYYPAVRVNDSKEFIRAFNAVVGEFGTLGSDLPQAELDKYLLAREVAGDAILTEND
jgi:1-acyl-sn-glycerol-3-phosphate acyltransferase